MLHYNFLDIESSLDLLNDWFVFCSNATEIPAIEPVAGPSSASDDSYCPRKRARLPPPPEQVEQGRWKDSSEPDEEPERMPFTPQRDPGFQLPRTQNWTPFDLFSLFFSEISITSIVSNTNKYADKYKSNRSNFHWFQLTTK